MNESEVTQIKIDGHTIGFVGLKDSLEDMAEAFSDKPDDVVANELLTRLSDKNYIPDTVKEKYGLAFVREFRKHLGQPFEDNDNNGLEIRVLGEGCTQCDKLEQDLMDLLAEMDLPADLEHVRDPVKIAQTGVIGTPALLINGKVMCSGRNPSKSKIKKWLEAAGE